MATITLQIDEENAWALAQFLKRSTWEQYRACAVDTDEADRIRTAITAIEGELARNGIAPR